MRNSFSVSYSYPVHFTRAVFAPGNPLLAEVMTGLAREGGSRMPCLVVIDSGVAACTPGLAARIDASVKQCPGLLLPRPPLVLPGGERAKDGLHAVSAVVEAAREACLCRQSYIWAVGGGALLDAVGLAAALFHRGVRLVRFPTTVLSQNDSGVGVKNGVNLGGVKNLIGTFSPPVGVINDLDFLSTLSARDWIAGSAEAFKVAVINDRDFLGWLCANAGAIPAREPDVMEQLVRRCATLHVQHIATSGDPFEFGSARPLDFGHWAAHKLETMTGFDLRHGEAVAIGIALDLIYASLAGMIAQAEAETIVNAMKHAGLPVWHDALTVCTQSHATPDILAGIDEFREHLGGQLHVTFPAPVGRRIEVTDVNRQTMMRAIDVLREFANPSGGHA
jgi:3-dehydroquinate synthase